jgi:hypothetical protein
MGDVRLLATSSALPLGNDELAVFLNVRQSIVVAVTHGDACAPGGMDGGVAKE